MDPRSSDVLSHDAVTSFHRDGFSIVRGLFPPEWIAEMLAESEGLLARKELIDTNNVRCRWQDHGETGECLLDGFDPVTDLAPAIRRTATWPVLLELLAGFLGQPACLFKDKLIYKQPGAKGYDLHQDYIAWPNFPRSFINAVVALDPCDAANGATEVFPRMHTCGCLSPEDGMYHVLPTSCVDESNGVTLTMNAGDVAFFGGFLPHRSAPNRSGTWRRQLYLSYNAENDGGDQWESHYVEFQAWLKDRYSEHGRHDTYFR